MAREKAEKNVLWLREKYDEDNWVSANIIANGVDYPPVMKAWAEMVIAKGRPTKRGEQAVLLDFDAESSIATPKVAAATPKVAEPPKLPGVRLASAQSTSRFRLKL